MAGGINKDFKVGELMVLNDHLNLMDGNPLIGPVSDDKMPRFPDQSVFIILSLEPLP